MRSIIDYFIKNEIAGNILMILLFIVGIFGYFQMKTTFFPEIESRVITIQCIYPGSSPEEIEEGVISKIEENLKGLTGLERVSSVSSENAGTVAVEVLKGYDTDVILQDVKNAVNRINSFPIDMEPLVIFKLENLGRVMSFAIYGDVPLTTLKKKARDVEDELLGMEGLSKVTLSGFPEEEIEIAFREKDLRAYDITFQEAADIIKNTNLEITGGTIKTTNEELLIRADNKEYNAKELLDIVVKSNPEGGLVRLYQIADVRDRWEDSPQRTYIDGQLAAVVTIQNTLEEDMLTIAEMVKSYIDDFNIKEEEVGAKIIDDASITLTQRIDLLTNNGILGFFLVMILLAMFLHFRLAFWVALAIPISFAGMFLCASLIGVTINVISLFGMIVVIGILVDDGIVIAENIYQHYERGEKPFVAALNGTMEVLPAVFAAIITTVIAFSAFFFIDGTLGDFFREMAIVVIFSLVFSLVEGALILPAHIAHSKALTKDTNPNVFMRGLDKMMSFLRDDLYIHVLRWAVKFNWPTIAICVAALFITFGALQGGLIKSTFFPVIPRDNFTVEFKLPAGTREDITMQILDSIEKVSLAINEELSESFYNGDIDPITKIQKNIGPATYEGTVTVTLADGETRGELTAREIISNVREKLGPINIAETLIFSSVSPFGKPISVSLLGSDRAELARAVDAVKDDLSKISELKDIVDNNQEGLKEISMTLTPKALSLGFTLGQIVTQVRQGFFGAEVQRIQRGEDEIRVWVRYELEDRSDISDLQDMRIRTQSGEQSIPLSELATFDTERGVININHIDGEREVRIEADVASDQVSISDITNDVRNVILPEVLKDFPSVRSSFEGQDREQAKTQKSLVIVMPLIFLIMFFVIVLTFKSISQALIVFALLPFGFVGVGLGHYVHGLPISLFSILGVIALVGIFVNDALVFITTFNEKIKRGMPHREAVIETGRSRFRPILLTSITTIAGLAPLIFEKSLQAQFLIPMAISVAYGLLIGTFILLVLIPALLVITNRIKRVAMSFYEGESIAAEFVEPAHSHRKSYFALYLIAGILAVLAFVMVVRVLMTLSEMIV